ncbi:MAG TPA: CbtA family protein, partial [Aquihabitans sp.]|nr:CbtA family protein [Aquihabitans sp.]
MTPTMKGFVLRGLAAGAVGGVAWALFLRFVTETQIDIALRYEDAAGLGAGPADDALFGRGAQQAGGMLGAVLYGMVLGLVLGVAVAALHHRIAAHHEFGRAVRVATGAFVALVAIPMLKYPPNPPTVGDPDTVADRTTDFLLLMGASIVVVFLAFFAWQWCTDRGTDGAPRFALVGGGLVVAVALLYAVWPASPDGVAPPDNEAAPAYVVADDAPSAVLDAMLATARATGGERLRDPADPDEPLDLDTVVDGDDLRGVPVVAGTSELVPHSYAGMVWHFRMQAFAGYALLWAVTATTFGLLADRRARTGGRAGAPPDAEPAPAE